MSYLFRCHQLVCVVLSEIARGALCCQNISEISREDDPFWNPPEHMFIGTDNVILKHLSHDVELIDRVVVTDYKGHLEGYIFVQLSPSTQNGDLRECDVDDPAELFGKPYHFKV